MPSSKRTRFVSLVALVAALPSLSCEQVVVNTIVADRIDIAPPTAFVRANATTRLTATVLSRDGRALAGRTVTWTSLHPTVASVDESGMVRGVAPGTATIQAATEGVLGTAEVTVTSGPAIATAPDTVDFVAVQNGATPGDRAVNVTNAGDGTLNGLTAAVTYATGQPVGWLSASLAGTAPTTLVLSANPSGLALGTYTATVTVASPVASNSPVEVTVRLTILAPQPAIALGATTVAFAAAQAGADPAPQNVAVTNAGGGTLTGLTTSIAYTSGQPTGWLTATLASGNAPTTLALRAATASLVQGTYTATVQLSSPVAQNTPQTVNVTFTVGAAQPGIGIDPSTLSFTATKGGANPATKTAQITNTGGGSLSGLVVSVTYPGGQPAGWVTTSLSGTTAPATITVGAVTGALDAGTYTATIRIASPAATNSPQSIEVSFQVQPPPPAIGVDRASVSFSTTRLAGDPAAQQVAITNTGGGTLSGLTRTVSYGSGEPTGWLTADLSATTAPTSLTLTARVGSLAVGTYNAKVQITAAGASNAPVDITVTFTIAAGPPAAPGAPAASAVSDRRIDVSWTDQSDNESRFDVERSANGLTGWAVIGSAATNQTSYADSTGLAGSTPYYYRVSACNAVACTPNPTVASATTAPDAPSSLATTAVASTRVDLTWTDNGSDETGFPIERSSNGGQTWSLLTTAAAGTEAYSDASAAPATTYRYRVRTCRNTVCSRYSNESQATTGTAPAAPSALAATATSSAQINLAWTDNSTNETQFRIEARSAATTFTQVGTVAANAPSFSHTGLNAKTEYFYRVRACTATECSSYSNETSATTPPNAPTALSASAPSHTQVNLSWTAPPETVTGYTIERRAGAAAFVLLATVTGGSTTTYTDTNNVQPTTSYTYRVKACDNTNCSAFSNEATVTTPAPPVVPPGAPSNLTASAVSSSRIDLAWTASSGTVSRYYIEQKNNTLAGNYAVIDSVSGGTLAYPSTGLAPLTSYSHRVRACNSSGCSGYSNEATTSTPALTLPNAPQNFDADAISATQIRLTWTHDGLFQVSSFEIERAPSSAQSNFTPLASVAGTARSYTDGGLTGSTSYYYRVRACNLSGCSAWSSVDNDRTLTPATPTNVAATAVSASQVTISWTPPGGQTSYVIRRRLNGTGMPTSITVSDANATSYLDSGLSSKTRYTYEIRACGAGGSCSSYSPAVSVTTH